MPRGDGSISFLEVKTEGFGSGLSSLFHGGSEECSSGEGSSSGKASSGGKCASGGGECEEGDGGNSELHCEFVLYLCRYRRYVSVKDRHLVQVQLAFFSCQTISSRASGVPTAT